MHLNIKWIVNLKKLNNFVVIYSQGCSKPVSLTRGLTTKRKPLACSIFFPYYRSQPTVNCLPT